MLRLSLRRRALLAGALSCAAAVASAPARADARKLTIAVGGKAEFCYLPLTLAEQLGYFRDEGLQVEIRDFASGRQAQEAVHNGQADLAAGAFEHVLRLQAQGKAFCSFVLQGRAPQIAFGLAANGAPANQGLAEWRGRRIGVSAPGSSTHTVALQVLKQAGLAPNEFSVVAVGTGVDALAALRSGQVDAMASTDPLMTLLEFRGELKIVSDTRTLRGTQQLFGGDMPGACLYAPQDLIDKRAATCQSLAHAIVHALKWLQTAGPSDLLKAVPEAHLLGDRAVALAAFNRVRESIALDGLMSEAAARTTLRVLATLDPTFPADKVDLSGSYTNSFARKAKDAFRA